MKCSCCGKKKNFFESYEKIIDTEGVYDICKNCCKIIYKIRDFSMDGNIEEVELNKKIIFEKNINDANASFSMWLNNFIKKHSTINTEL